MSSQRVVRINDVYFNWPIGAVRPQSYAIRPERLDEYLATQVPGLRVANDAESEATLNANQAGPRNRKLEADELARCYRDGIGYERFFASEGVELASAGEL